MQSGTTLPSSRNLCDASPGFTLGVKTQSVCKQMTEFGETEGTVLSLIVFLVLGLAMIPAAVAYWDLTTTVYALLSLTIVRMLPVAVSLVGLGIDLRTTLFMGWFGPRMSARHAQVASERRPSGA